MMIGACMKASKAVQAEMWMMRMQDTGVEPNATTYHSVAQAFASVGCVAGVHRTFLSMTAHKFPMDSHAVSVLLSACTNAESSALYEATPILRHWIGEGVLKYEMMFKTLGRTIGFKAARLLCEELKVSARSLRGGAGRASGRHCSSDLLSNNLCV